MLTESIQKFFYFAAFVPEYYISFNVADLLWLLVLEPGEGYLAHFLHWVLFDSHWSVACFTQSWTPVSSPATSATVIWDPSLDHRWCSTSPQPNREALLCTSLRLGNSKHNCHFLRTTLGSSHQCSASQKPSSASIGLSALLHVLHFPRLCPGKPGSMLSLLGHRVSINVYIIHFQLWIHSMRPTSYSWPLDFFFLLWLNFHVLVAGNGF